MDYEYQPANPADGLAIGADGQFLFAMGDGSVQFTTWQPAERNSLAPVSDERRTGYPATVKI